LGEEPHALDAVAGSAEEDKLMTDEPKVFTLLRQFDEAKAQLWRMEQELNAECINYARSKGRAFLFPHHIRNIMRLSNKEQDQ